MIIRKQLVKRSIAGDVILVPVGDASLELKGLLTLNETGERMWDLLPRCDTEDALVQQMLEEYEVDEATAEADVAEFLQQMREIGALVEEADGQK